MNKIISLIKVSLNHDMNMFKIHTKKQNVFSKVLLPFFITAYLMFFVGIYASKMISLLKTVHLEFVILTLFGLIVSIITLIEGIYKSSSLLFDCRDDQLMFSLPIKKNTVLLIRVFKFYVFELLYNSLFLLPAMIVYAYNIQPGLNYYLLSFIALLLLPIVPIVLSCFIGFIITFLSSYFKGKNIVQTIITVTFLLLIMYGSYNLDSFMKNIVADAANLNQVIVKLYYPVGVYVSLINDFNIIVLCKYIFVHLFIFIIAMFLLGKVYFKINSNNKRVIVSNKNHKYVIKCHSRMFSFIRKELNRFVSTPVFITNAGFGLVLFIIACIFSSIKFDYVVSLIMKTYPNISINYIKQYLPVVMFGLVCFTSFMTSITSSMISLENKSFNILKSLPIKPVMIVLYKLLSALVVMIPCIIIGDLIVFIKFRFDIISVVLILVASILLPFVSELIGIIVNLKYPKLDATNDTEVVKQSLSSAISVFIGMGLIGITGVLLYKMVEIGLTNYLILTLLIYIYGVIALCLWIFLLKTCDESFNNINV